MSAVALYLFYTILYFSGNMKICQEKNRTTENAETQVHKSQEHKLKVKSFTKQYLNLDLILIFQSLPQFVSIMDTIWTQRIVPSER